MVLLFIDLLGVKARWVKKGKIGAELVFTRFRNIVAGTLKGFTNDQILKGTVESDSLVLVCINLPIALQIAEKLYRETFLKDMDDNERRLWFRGVITKMKDEEYTRISTKYKEPLQNIDIFLYGDSLLEAIQVEKSGIKGMRMLVDKDLVTDSIKKSMKYSIGKFYYIPLKQLQHSGYPDTIRGRYFDFMWMSDKNTEVEAELKEAMAKRFRYSAKDSEEFVQAAATHLLFNESTAIKSAIGHKDKALAAERIKKANRKGFILADEDEE